MFKPDQLKAAGEMLDELIEIQEQQKEADPKITLLEKLDRLTELVDALRFQLQDNDLQRETTHRHSRMVVSLPESKIRFLPGKAPTYKRASQPQRLALPLLEHLYHHPGRGRRVLVIINEFIRSRLAELHPADFERTATGVLRIVTSVRFAARKLRENGLLQFTHAEAFKTWRLSFIGLLVASGWGKVSERSEAPTSDFILKERILGCLYPFQTLPSLVQELRTMCVQCGIPTAHVADIEQVASQALAEYSIILSTGEHTRAKVSDCESLLLRISHADPVQRLVKAWDRPEGEGGTLL